MGSKSSSAPPPDPRLVEAQLKSMGIQDSAIQRILDTSESMIPLQREQTQFALDTGRQAVSEAKEDRSWMLTRRAMLSGVQDRLVDDANKFDSKARADEFASEASADANAAISNARAQSSRAMARMGIVPGSGRAEAADARSVLGEAAMLAGAKNNARRSARAEGYALTDRATNALAGYPAMSAAASGQGASIAAGGVGTVNAGVGGMSSGFGTAANVAASMGANATNMWGAQAGYKTNQDQIAASNNPLNTILGAAAGVGAQWAAGRITSDRRLKTDIKAVGVDERTGLTLYEFNYLNDASGRRWRGVMADEVERVDRDAVVYDDMGFASVNYARLGIDMVEV